ncbi:hypothetical protein EYC79_18155 [Agrobacterium cavarae]|uniref:Uncharacterized protein n=1 Tax=Agrobacterium cavarae TaxID=2528239 RepID=A0ABY1Y652_9HYPH|nr:hypothetical protein [Agrobacterium cavarae]TBN10873.1 hypothetical protein EYC79_18155 [Agrobacterium cavarae]
MTKQIIVDAMTGDVSEEDFTPETFPIVTAFLPIEPTPFWLAAHELLQLKKSDVLNAIADPDERYEAELEIEGRKTYRRDDPMVIKLAQLKGYPPAQMDDLWLYVQQHYR